MSFPYFISPEQAMRERSELARKGIARGRSVVALAYAGGVLFVAENPSRSLQKVSEIYDRVGFAAVGRFNEFDSLRRGGIQYADTRGYAYDRRDVTGRQLANVYAQTLGTIFTEQAKPYEVELCVAEVAHYGETKPPELYRITYDGSIADEPHFVVMGGTTEQIINALKASYSENAELAEAVCIAVGALRSGITSAAGNATPPAEPRVLGPSTLEVAILDTSRTRRAFAGSPGRLWKHCCRRRPRPLRPPRAHRRLKASWCARRNPAAREPAAPAVPTACRRRSPPGETAWVGGFPAPEPASSEPPRRCRQPQRARSISSARSPWRRGARAHPSEKTAVAVMHHTDCDLCQGRNHVKPGPFAGLDGAPTRRPARRPTIGRVAIINQ